MATLFRVVNQQKIIRSILLDKIDRSQGNFTGYANRAKQKLYVPYVNPLDTTVKGYVDLAPTDQVLQQVNQPKGVIAQLFNKGYVTFVAFNSVLTKTPVITASASATPVGSSTTTGTTFLSLAPDHTYVTLTTPGGSKQILSDTAITLGGGTVGATSIIIPNAIVTIGTPAAGWNVQVKANSKLSNIFTMT